MEIIRRLTVTQALIILALVAVILVGGIIITSQNADEAADAAFATNTPVINWESFEVNPTLTSP